MDFRFRCFCGYETDNIDDALRHARGSIRVKDEDIELRSCRGPKERERGNEGSPSIPFPRSGEALLDIPVVVVVKRKLSKTEEQHLDGISGCGQSYFGERVLCTLPKGHSGAHVAEALDGEIVAVWGTPDVVFNLDTKGRLVD